MSLTHRSLKYDHVSCAFQIGYFTKVDGWWTGECGSRTGWNWCLLHHQFLRLVKSPSLTNQLAWRPQSKHSTFWFLTWYVVQTQLPCGHFARCLRSFKRSSFVRSFRNVLRQIDSVDSLMNLHIHASYCSWDDSFAPLFSDRDRKLFFVYGLHFVHNAISRIARAFSFTTVIAHLPINHFHLH